MQTTFLRLLVAAVITGLGFASRLSAQNSVWSGASGTDTNWSNALNWSPNGVPGAVSNVIFGNTVAGASPLTNNVVDTSLVISSLSYTNSAGSPGNYQGTLISAGQTLTVTNGFSVGGVAGSGNIGNALIAGPGTLAVSNNVFVVQLGASGDGVHQAVLDMSGLSSFKASVSRFGVGFYTVNNASRSSGLVYLAQTNVIIVTNSGATSYTNGFVVTWNANSGGSSVNNKGSTVYLGQTNIILADGVVVGSVKSAGTIGSQATGGLLAFNPNGLNNPNAYFRNKDGVNRVSIWAIGDDSALSGSNQGASGTNDFTGGYVDAAITNLNIGVTGIAANTGGGTGTLTYNAGTIDANNVTNGLCLSTSTGIGTGTINISGTAKLKVNNVLALAVKGSGTGSPAASGTLNVSGGTVTVQGPVVAGGGSSTINLTGGTVNLTNVAASVGTLASPITSFSMADTVLNLAIGAGVVPIEAYGLYDNDPVTVNITTLPVISTFPTQLPVIQYGYESGDLTTIALGSLPSVAAVPYKGYLSNNVDNFSVDLVITNGFVPTGTDVWTGTNNASWDFTSPNWLLFGAATLFVNGANVQFDDTAAGTTSVNLAGTLTPASLVVSNNTKNYVFGGAGSIGGSVSLVKNGSGTLAITNAGNNTFSGGILISNGTVQFGNGSTLGNLPAGALTISDNGTLLMNQSGSVAITNNITGSGNFVQAGSGVDSLSGSNSYAGQTSVTGGSLMVDGYIGGLPTSVLTNAPGTVVGGNGTNLGVFNADGIINPGDAGAIGTFSTANGLTVYANGSLTFDLNSANNTEGSGVNDLLQITGDLNATNATIAVNIQGGLPQLGMSYPVITYSGALHGSFNPVVKAHFPVTVDTSTPNQVNIIITGTNGAALKWNSTGSSTWDLGGTANWFNFGTSATDVFGQGDSVLFDDSVAGVQTNIIIPAGVAVYPSAITNISTANSYTISGGGTIGGPTALIKGGTNTLTVNTTNSFTGGVMVLSGIFKAGSGTAFGLNNTPTITNIIASGATIDENGQNLGSATFMVSGAGYGGNGAIINSGPDQSGNTAFQNIVLAGDTTFGGPGNAAGGGNTAGRWDIRGGTPTLTCLNGNAYNLTKVGSNQVTLVGVTVDPNLANILVQGGVFGVQGAVTSLGNPTNVLGLYNTGTLLHCAGFSSPLNKVIVMTNATVDCTGTGVNEFDGSVTLYGTNTLSLTDPLTFTGGLGGPGGFTKSGAGSLTLVTGTNTYTGNTVISAGTLYLQEPAGLTNSANISFAAGSTIDVNGRYDQSLSVNSGHTLSGGGNINGSLTNNLGASCFVGGNRTIGTNVISYVANLLGTTYMDVTNNGARYDVVQASIIIFGGTLVFSNLDATHPFTAGQSFQLFSGSCSGAFANIVPPTPGPGLGWDTNSLASSGVLNIISTVVPQPHFANITLSGTNLVFSGTNGSINGTFSVLTSTNLTLPLNQWITNASSQFDGSGNFSVTNPVSPNTPQQFFMLKTP